MEKKKIISLGMNCEVSFQIERYVDKLDASLFSWTFVENDELFMQALNNLDEIFENNISFNVTSEDMFWCERFRIAFHGRTNKSLLFDSDGNIINQELYDTNLAELKSRISHLKDKFKEQLQSNDEIYFIKKLEVNNDIQRAKDIILQLYDYFETYSTNGVYKLFIVVEDVYLSHLECLEKDRLYIRSLDYFASPDNTKDGADNKGWGAIFHEILTGEKILKESMSENMLQLYQQLHLLQEKCMQQEFEIEKLRHLIGEKDKWIGDLQSGKYWLEQQYLELIKHPKSVREKIGMTV